MSVVFAKGLRVFENNLKLGCAQWLEVAHFQSKDRTVQFREDFMLLVGNDNLGTVTESVFARAIADALEMDGQ